MAETKPVEKVVEKVKDPETFDEFIAAERARGNHLPETQLQEPWLVSQRKKR